MDGYIWALVIVSFIALFGLTIWLLISYFTEKRKIRDDPIILNFLAPIDHGFFLGTQISDITGKDGRHVIQFEPKDIDLLQDNKEKMAKQQEPVDVIVAKNKLFAMPKGSISKLRNVNIVLPKSASDFPEALKESLIGKGLMWAVEAQNAINSEINSLREGHNRKDKIFENIGHGEASTQFMGFMQELYKDALKASVDLKGKDNKPTSVLNPGAMGSMHNQ
jgi:hypothetical protein